MLFGEEDGFDLVVIEVSWNEKVLLLVDHFLWVLLNGNSGNALAKI